MDSASDPETSGDEIFSDVETDNDSGSFSEEDVEHAADGHAPKRRKLAGRSAREALHGVGDGIDHVEDAEASLLALEVRELLGEAALSKEDVNSMTALAHTISTFIESLPEATVDSAPVRGLLADFDFPASRKFTFKPPNNSQIIGSFAIGAASLLQPVLDVALEMPEECFDDKDQLNHRYHAKRALYLAHIAAALRKNAAKDGGLSHIEGVEWATFKGDCRRPVLLLKLEKGSVAAPGAAIRLIPAASPTLFPLHKLAPTRNNLRSVCKPAAHAQGKGDKNAASEPELLPTPYYNSGILVDMLLLGHTKVLQAVTKKVPAMAQALILLKVWSARQRLSEGADGVDGFVLTAMLAQLLESGKASTGMSAMHLFRAVLMSLKNRKTFNNLSFNRSALGTDQSSSTSPPTAKTWRTAGSDVVFLDSTGWLNLTAHISGAALKQVQACAERTAAVLSTSAGPDAFDTVFLASKSLGSLYDVWYKVSIPKEKESSTGSAALSSDYPIWAQMDKKVAEVATKALGDRANLVRVISRGAVPAKDVEKRLKKGGSAFQPERSFVLLAARLDPTTALRGVDIGPAADSGPAAAQFRAFWGDKSELRRFQDGKIAEAVVWEVSPSQRHVIVDAVVRYALNRHLTSGAKVEGFSGVVDGALRRKHGSPDADVAATRLCEAAALRLGKRLRTLDNLTLKIVGTQPLAPVLRHADAFPPQPHLLAGAAHNDVLDPESETVPRCVPAVELLCQLEGSGKWPDNPAPFAKMKAALGVQLAETLQSSFGIEASAAEDYVDVLTDGFAFRLILNTERDVAMQNLMLQAAGMPHLPPEEDVSLRLWHHGAVSAAAAANPAFEPSVRLAKRWIAAQWLSPHFRDEAIELVVAIAFTSGEGVAAPPPGSRLSGFLRFLQLLGTHPWAASPLIGDVATGDPGSARRDAAARAYAAQRAAEMAPAMFITGPKDNECVGWTREHPTKPMLYRAAVLARRAADTLEGFLCGSDADESAADTEIVLERVFHHDESDYEVVVQMRSDALPTRDLALQKKKVANVKKAGWAILTPQVPADEAKRSRAVLKGIPRSVVQTRGVAAVRRELLIGFDPVPLFVSLLEERFGAVAVVCADYLGGSKIGLKLRGPALKPGPLRPEAAHASEPLVIPTKGQEDAELIVGPDLAAIAADCMALGAGLVESVHYRED